MNEQLAVLVYGTLRNGQHNYEIFLKGNTTEEFPATVDGFVLYGRGIPFAVPRDGGQIIGELMVINPERYEDVLANLDSLEGYREQKPEGSLYQRVVREVQFQTPDGEWQSRDAYLYQAGSRLSLNGWDSKEIPGGDWVAFSHSA